MDARQKLEALAAQDSPSKTRLEAGVQIFAEAVAATLKVKPDEVAVLLLTTTGNTLKFLWPTALRQGAGAIPADHKTAFASEVLRTLKGKVDNKLSESKHLRFFENVKGMETSGLPIQKMVALPLVHSGKAIGVVEVSRKGKTPEDSGPNFTQEDAQRLVGLCKELAPALASLTPSPFV
ncbi:MAG: hypothetical protein AB1347_00015 [Acidobacteriota bacterium]